MALPWVRAKAVNVIYRYRFLATPEKIVIKFIMIWEKYCLRMTVKTKLSPKSQSLKVINLCGEDQVQNFNQYRTLTSTALTRLVICHERISDKVIKFFLFLIRMILKEYLIYKISQVFFRIFQLCIRSVKMPLQLTQILVNFFIKSLIFFWIT